MLWTSSLRFELKKHVKTSAHAFPLFYATYFHSSDGKAKKEEKKRRSKRWNITQRYFSHFSKSFLTIRTLAIRVIAQTTSGERENVLHDNLYGGLIVSINEPRLKVRKRVQWCISNWEKRHQSEMKLSKVGSRSPQTHVTMVLMKC